MDKGKRRRAQSTPTEQVGTSRYKLYCQVWDQLRDAQAAGYYLESISLLESLIADRLESRAAYLVSGYSGFDPLGRVVTLLRDHEQNAAFRVAIDRIDEWRKDRNRALHELAKLASGEKATWEDKTADLPIIVEEGCAALLEFDTLDRADRHAVDKMTATEPFAFDESRRGRILRRHRRA
jgi:hypothetical protein